jgi:RND superfamily putative drug exporter
MARRATVETAVVLRHKVAASLAAGVVRLRWFVVIAWICGGVAATFLLPTFTSSGASFGNIVSKDSPVISAEVQSITEFDFPIIARTVVVQRNPDGLDGWEQARIVLRALAYDQRGPVKGQPLGALPVLNTGGLIPGSREQGTTALTFLFSNPTASFGSQMDEARRWVAANVDRPDDSLAGITGTVPARVTQGDILGSYEFVVEVVTLVAVLGIVALAFRSVVAPLLALSVAIVAYLVTVRVLGGVGELLGLGVPSDVEPVVVALLLGVVTDYSTFYISGLRACLREGRSRHEAAGQAVLEQTPIVLAAGLTVAAGAGALTVARSDFFQAFGPALGLTVLTSVAVCVTLLPALLSILGDRVFWPSHQSAGARVQPPDAPVRSRGKVIGAVIRRPVAALVAIAGVAGLVACAMPVRHMDLGFSVVQSLPASAEPARADRALQQGFAPGMVSPAVLVVQRANLASDRGGLLDLEEQLRRFPGIAGVAGPAETVLPLQRGLAVSEDGDAARYVLILGQSPLGARAIDTMRDLQGRLPRMLAHAELSGANASVAGDTALAAEVVGQTRRDLGRIVLTAALVDFILLAFFLRALIAPLYLLLCSGVSVLATLGLTTYVMQDVLHRDGLTFYVPIAAAVLLVAFGADYNVLGVGSVWEEASRRPLREAIALAVPRSTRAISIAGVTLALSFGLLVLVPLAPFSELAFAMSVGILLDALLVRSLLVPAILVLIGRASAWPGSGLSFQRAPGAGTSRRPALHATEPPAP